MGKCCKIFAGKFQRGGCNINIEVRRSKRKTVAIQITTGQKIVVKVPLHFPESKIPEILQRYDEWIKKTLEQMKEKSEKYPEPDEEQCSKLKKMAGEVLPGKVKYYSALTGLNPVGVKITGAKKRFGSCSGKNSLCFSYLLMRYPEECIDYVVLHEIAHIKHHNHSKDFYALVEKYMPDYREREKRLKLG